MKTSFRNRGCETCQRFNVQHKQLSFILLYLDKLYEISSHVSASLRSVFKMNQRMSELMPFVALQRNPSVTYAIKGVSIVVSESPFLVGLIQQNTYSGDS